MKKIVLAVCTFVLLGSTFVAAAPGVVGKKIMSQIINAKQAAQTVEVAGSKIFVPKGQTIIVGQRSNGSLVIRGNDLKEIQLNGSTISTNGYSIVSYQPTSNIVFLDRGESLTVVDPAGVPATVTEGGAVSAVNATVNTETSAELKEQAKAESAQVTEAIGEVLDVPAFVDATETSSAASEQAAQDVEETEKTLSPSAPR